MLGFSRDTSISTGSDIPRILHTSLRNFLVAVAVRAIQLTLLYSIGFSSPSLLKNSLKSSPHFSHSVPRLLSLPGVLTERHYLVGAASISWSPNHLRTNIYNLIVTIGNMIKTIRLILLCCCHCTYSKL